MLIDLQKKKSSMNKIVTVCMVFFFIGMILGKMESLYKNLIHEKDDG